jgi:hypothetical protein
MVRRYSDSGKSWWEEPPYTEDEEMDFYRRIGSGPVTVFRGQRPSSSPRTSPGNVAPPSAKPPRP